MGEVRRQMAMMGEWWETIRPHGASQKLYIRSEIVRGTHMRAQVYSIASSVDGGPRVALFGEHELG